MMKNKVAEPFFKSCWDSREVLKDIFTIQPGISASEIAELEPMLWNDICSEYDGRHFFTWAANSGISFCPAFKEFERLWIADENNHYQGFRMIYSWLYGQSEQDIEDRLQQRAPDFTSLLPLLTDEFFVCLVFAYDEIATARSYGMDIELYRRMGGGSTFLESWIRQVARDEAMHFKNITNIITSQYGHRTAEIPSYIDRLIQHDLSETPYTATFVLDHKGHYFTEEFLQKCKAIIMRVTCEMASKTQFFTQSKGEVYEI